MQGTWAPSLVWEDSRYRRETKSAHHNHWACALRLLSLEPVLRNQRSQRKERGTAARRGPLGAKSTQHRQRWVSNYPCACTIPSYLLRTKGKQLQKQPCWEESTRGKSDSYTTPPQPHLCDVKILHFPWPFLHNFSINPKTAFTEGRVWIEHNFHFTKSDKASQGSWESV